MTPESAENLLRFAKEVVDMGIINVGRSASERTAIEALRMAIREAEDSEPPKAFVEWYMSKRGTDEKGAAANWKLSYGDCWRAATRAREEP